MWALGASTSQSAHHHWLLEIVFMVISPGNWTWQPQFVLHAVNHPEDFKIHWFFCLQLSSAGFTLFEKWMSEWYYWRRMPAFCWLLVCSCPIKAQMLVFALPPCCGQVWCCGSGLARPWVSCTDLNALGWRPGYQWSIKQILENLGTCPPLTTATESLLLTAVGDGFPVLSSKCRKISVAKCLAICGGVFFCV